MPNILRITSRCFFGATVVAVIASCAHDAGHHGVAVSDAMKNAIAREGYAAIVLASDGQTKIVNARGEEIKPCGEVKGTEITGDCHLNHVDFKNTDEISIWVTTGSPKCATIRRGGYLMQMHVDTNPGHWKAGDWFCHEGSDSGHRH